jgi:SAM-dependent methyltransferase
MSNPLSQEARPETLAERSSPVAARSPRVKSLCFYGGVFATTAATLMLQIIETRIVSVTSWYHLAFFIISIGMFGLTGGAVWVYLRSESFARMDLNDVLARNSFYFALSTILTLLIQMTLVTSSTGSLTSLFAWAELAIALAIPFFFSGVIVSLALTRSPYPIGIVYGVDLVGAAVGCIGVLLVLDLANGPTAILWIAALGAAAASLFAAAGSTTALFNAPTGAPELRYRLPLFLGILLLAILNPLTDRGIYPSYVKDGIETPKTFAFQGWNSFSRVTLSQSREGEPAMWGASPRMPPYTITQQWMTLDGSAGTSMYKFGGTLEDVSFLRYDITNLAYRLPGLEAGAVIGVGGGRDVLSARLFGVKSVIGVEINPILIDLLTRRYSDYTAISKLQGVSFANDEARSWFARTDRSFDIIQMSLIDTWAATGAGAYTLTENGLYTVEAWQIFLRRLNPNGVFTVSRWYAPGEVNETGRMVALATATLLDLGIKDPRTHLFLASGGNIATIVVSKSPLSPEALAALKKGVADLGFSILISPGETSASPLLQSIVDAPDRAQLRAATDKSYLDLTPSYDARPFFFNQLRFDRLFGSRPVSADISAGVYAGNIVATLTLAMLVFISALLVVGTIVVPLYSAVKDTGWGLAVGGTSYFLLIGIGFMMTEIALVQRMSVFLGHPVYALSVVLFSLILATGIGALVSEKFQLNSASRLFAWAILTAVYIVALPYWMPPILLQLDSAQLLTRAGFAVLVLAPAGFLMGFGFPTGMRLVGEVDRRPMPWFWGVNGAGGVLAASVAVLTSMAFSIDTSLQVGGLCYLLLVVPAAGLWRAVAGRQRRGAAVLAT